METTETTPTLSNIVVLGDGSEWTVPPLSGAADALPAQLAFVELQRALRELGIVLEINKVEAEGLTDEEKRDRESRWAAARMKAILEHCYPMCCHLYRRDHPDVTDEGLGRLFPPRVLDEYVEAIFVACYRGGDPAPDPTSDTTPTSTEIADDS
jgi:hypothetical protein